MGLFFTIWFGGAFFFWLLLSSVVDVAYDECAKELGISPPEWAKPWIVLFASLGWLYYVPRGICKMVLRVIAQRKTK